MSEDLWMVEAVIQPFKLDAVTLALEGTAAFRGMTVTDCRGFGHEKLTNMAEGALAGDKAAPILRHGDADVVDFTPKVKLEAVVWGRVAADAVADTIVRVARTGRRGDGKVFVWPLARAVRIRTLDEGAKAV